MYKFKNKIAVVTGGSRGIGRAVVCELAKRGCKVAIIARASEQLSEIGNTLSKQGHDVCIYPCDLSDDAQIQHLIETLINDYSRIDVLINCAGVGKLGPITAYQPQDIKAPLMVPLLCAMLLSKGLLPVMLNRNDGRIINIITPASYFDLPYMAPYTASRTGLLSFSRSLDEEVRDQGVRVRTVCPAWVETEYLNNNASDGDWFPKVANYFPVITAEQSADYVIDAITGSKQEIKPAFLLKLFTLSYRWFPRLSVNTFKIFKLYRPLALNSVKKNVPGAAQWTNWEESIDLKAQKIAFPKSIEQVQSVVTDHDHYPSPVRAAGSRHTTTHCGVADNGTLMVMRGMDRILEIDVENNLVTVQAGALYIDVAKALRKHGLQFYVNVEIGNLTMGSAASTGTKDASMPNEYGQVCSYCTAVKMVMADGSINIIDEQQSELLSAVRSSYGLLGIIVETTFKVKPITAMSVRHQSYTLDEFEQALPELKKAGESIMYYLFPFQNKLTVEFRRYTNDKPKRFNHWLWRLRNLCWKTIAPTFCTLATRHVNNKTIRYFLIDNFYKIVSFVVCTVLKSPVTLATDQIIRYPEHKNIAKYTFSIWAFPEQHIMPTMRAYYQFCQDYYRENGFRCDMLNVGYRIEADQNPIFSYSYEGDVMTLDPVTTGSPGWDDFLKAYNEFCSCHNGVPLFNQSKWLTRNQVQKAFAGRIGQFWNNKIKLDNKNRFLNNYFNQLFSPDY